MSYQMLRIKLQVLNAVNCESYSTLIIVPCQHMRL